MNYTETLKKIEDENYLIGMISVDDILRFGYSLELNENSKVLDLCCGYGTLLKIWSEEFGVTGRGVDQFEYFLNVGKQRLQDSKNRRVELICDDVMLYQDEEKYDVVICSETIDSVEITIQLGEKFLKPGGILVFHKLYTKTDHVPQELIDFDGDIHSLAELYHIFAEFGYCISHMATGNNDSFERYIMREERNNIEKMNQNPGDESAKQWVKEWNQMYFEYRRHYEEQALFGLTKI